VALTFAAAGIAKLVPAEAERKLFRSWGWSDDDRRIIGAAELGGAAMLMTPSFSFLGGLLLAATSTCIATAELRHGNNALVTPRLGLLAAATSTLAIRR
ncbi:MAG: DoxX family protein, partial [Gluconacetobacter diazotrophicus]|nr:DoxX family protein [Gluconacetobacter diazotrophicus]